MMYVQNQGANRCITAYPVVAGGTLDSAASLKIRFTHITI